MKDILPIEWIKSNFVPLRLAARIVIASVLTFVLCHALGLKQSQWAVLTAVVVMQSSVGASLKVTFDRFVGSIGGALWGVCVLLVLPLDTALARGVALAITLIPLALVAAFKPVYRIAPITGAILLLAPMMVGTTAWQAGLNRILEVGIGSVVALAVALVVFPVRAHEALAKVVGRALGLLADMINQMSEAAAGRDDRKARADLHREIRQAIAQTESTAEEAMRERLSHLVHAPDPQPICRTLRRLHNDLTMMGRTVDTPLSEMSLAPLAQTAERATAAIAAYLRSSAEALASRQQAPPLDEVKQALAIYTEATAQARLAGVTRDLPDKIIGRIFGLSFGFVQLNENLEDLALRTDEFAVVKVKRQRRVPV